VAQPTGAGWAGYCSATLWSHWDPSDPFFQGFLTDLWSPRARYALRLPPGAAVEISGEEQALHLLNVGAQTMLADVATFTTDNHLYAGGFAQVPDLADRVTAPAVMIVTAELRARQFVTLPRVPVALLPVGSGAVAYLRRYDSAGLSLLVGGPGASLTLDLHHQRDFTTGQALTAQVVIAGGAYPIAPGSRHQVNIDAGFGHRTTGIATADEQGRLSFTVSGGKINIDIAPEPAGGAG
jgi:hypothetical protein